MSKPLTDEVRQFFEEPNFVHLAMLREDGSPQVAPVWATLEGDRVIVSTTETSPKIKALRRDPRVALSVLRQSDPYHEAYMRGRVVEFRKAGAAERMTAIAHKYIGKDFPFGVEHQISIYIEIDNIVTRKLPLTPPA